MKAATATALSLFVTAATTSSTSLASAAPGANNLLRRGDIIPNGASIPVDTEYGMRLLSRATASSSTDGRRHLENNQEEDTTWMINYALRFDSCHEIASINGEGGGGGGGAEGMEGQAGIQRLVKLRLCPKDSCSSHCSNGAEYVVEMREFLETYTKMKEEMEEQQCQYQEEKCEYSCQYNDNGGNNNNNNQNNNGRALEDANNGNNNQNNNYNEEYCLQSCLQEAGYGDCYEGQNNNNNNGQEEFEIERFAECEPLNEGGGNNNNNNNNYNYNNGNGNGYQAAYVGAYCGGGGSRVNLGVFSDAACTVKSDDSLFQKYYYYSLPYTTTSIIGRECFSCDAAEYEFNENNGNGNNNYNNNYEISQMCEEVHERSAKCEKNLKIGTSQSAYSNNGYTRYYPHTESCQFIHSTLSGLESVTRSNGRSLRTARAFAWIFAVTTLACVGYIVWLHSEKRKRSSVDLNSTYGGGAGGWS